MAGAALLLLLVVAGGIVYYVTRPIHIDLSADGQPRLVETRANSVVDLLTELDIDVTEADLVSPPLDAELAEGDTIVVQFARPLTMVVDGVETIHITTELTIGAALQEAGAPIDGAALSLRPEETLPRSGARVEVITPKSVTLDVGGVARTLTTTAGTVGDMLDAEGITLAPTDTLGPAADTAVTEAMAITVTRIRVETEVRTEPIAHDTVERDDSDLTIGTRKVVTAGVDGSKNVTYAITYTNDEATSEEAMETTVTAEPTTEIVAVGTKPAPAPAAPSASAASASGGSAGLNWAALAKCESSGNPQAVNPAGYYGLYQFSLSTWASVGGSGKPTDASADEQTTRAQILYERSGAGQWPHCGPRLFS